MFYRRYFTENGHLFLFRLFQKNNRYDPFFVLYVVDFLAKLLNFAPSVAFRSPK